MPIYLYRHPKTKKVVEIVQHMNDIHEFIDSSGVRYDRVFITPRMSVDTITVDPFSEAEFMRRTHKKITLGDMMDESAALSEKRAAKLGKDPIKQRVFDKYRKKTGKPHPEEAPKRIETEHFIAELD